MKDHLVIPDAAVKYILFQRTGYLRFPSTRAYRTLCRVLPFPLYNRAVTLEAALSKARVKELYRDDMRREYLSIKDHLPRTCSSVLDIGCGVGGINYFISRHWPDRSIEFYLLDKTCTDSRVYYMFEPKGAFYNSLAVAKSLLVDSGMDAKCVHLIEASDTNELGLTREVDLVVSLISWGFHYPVETYLDAVYGILSADGVVILDVRKGTGGDKTLQKKFRETAVILDAEKFVRVAARK